MFVLCNSSLFANTVDLCLPSTHGRKFRDFCFGKRGVGPDVPGKLSPYRPADNGDPRKTYAQCPERNNFPGGPTLARGCSRRSIRCRSTCRAGPCRCRCGNSPSSPGPGSGFFQDPAHPPTDQPTPGGVRGTPFVEWGRFWGFRKNFSAPC